MRRRLPTEWSKKGKQGSLPALAFFSIMQRRRQMLVHSCIYYQLNSSLVSDHQWQEWAHDLALWQSFAGALELDFYDAAFADWDGSTGYHLPCDPDIIAVARSLLNIGSVYP